MIRNSDVKMAAAGPVVTSARYSRKYLDRAKKIFGENGYLNESFRAVSIRSRPFIREKESSPQTVDSVKHEVLLPPTPGRRADTALVKEEKGIRC